jgi:hypothetical protein
MEITSRMKFIIILVIKIRRIPFHYYRSGCGLYDLLLGGGFRCESRLRLTGCYVFIYVYIRICI